MIDRNDVARYLVGRGLLSAEAIVDGELRVVDASRRNRNYQVVASDGRSYFVKQGVGSTRTPGTVAYEATVLDILHASPHGTGLVPHLPRSFGFDASNGVLLLELVPNAENLRHYHVRIGRMPVRVAEAVGRTLGALHSNNVIGTDSSRVLSQHLPEVFSIARPTLGVFRSASAGNAALIGYLQQFPELTAMLEIVGREWRSDRLIHGDPRWDNWMLARASGQRQRPRPRLVDWEFAGVGDPAWDIASVLGEYLSSWVLSIPELPGISPDGSLPLAVCPLERVQPAMRRLWQAYARQRQLDSEAWSEEAELLRTLCFVGAKLVHLASERMHRARDLTTSVTALLQLAANVLADPRRAATHLVGLGVSEFAAA